MLTQIKNSMPQMLGFVVYFTLVFASTAAGEGEKYSYQVQGKRDPFIPLISPAGFLLNLEPQENSVLSLEGIMYDPKGDSIAIINGELLKVGESAGDAVITSIEPDKVTVMKDNIKQDIELRREE